MNDEEKKALRLELENFKKNLPEYATKEDIDAKMSTMQKAVDAGGTDEIKKILDDLVDVVEKQGFEMQKRIETDTAEKSLQDVIAEQAESFKKIAKGEISRHSFEYNAKTLTTRGNVLSSTQAMRLPGIGNLAFLAPTIEQTFRSANVGPNSNGIIRYVDESSVTRNAGTVAESAVKPESGIVWTEYTLPVQKIADTIPVTMEAFEDVDFITSELDRLLNINLQLKLDEQLYSGDGTPPNLVGVNTTATAWTPPAASVDTATIYDLLVKMAESIVASKKGKYMQTGMIAYMNIADINKMKLAKDVNKNYIMPPFVTESGRIIDGIVIVESGQVTADTLTMGDSNRYGTVYSLGGVRLDTGFIDKQFVENTFTLLAEVRKALLIRTADADAFAKTASIAADLVTLTAP